MNPYWDCSFIEFFQIFFSRLIPLLMGAAPAADEVQLGTLAMIALSCGLIGPFLVLKRMAMFANSLSHTVLFGIASAFLIASKLWGGQMNSLSTLLIGGFVAALLTAFLTQGLVRFFRVQPDASVGFVFSTLFALGVLLVTLFTRNVHLSVEAILGNADALAVSDFHFSAFLAAGLSLLVFLLYRGLKISCFDAGFGAALGFRPQSFHLILLLFSAAVCVGAFRAVGVLLVLAFLTGPYLTARLFSKRLGQLLFLSPLLGILASFAGVSLSRHFLSAFGTPLSTAGLVVCVIGVLYGLAVFFKRFFHAKMIPACEKGSPS